MFVVINISVGPGVDLTYVNSAVCQIHIEHAVPSQKEIHVLSQSQDNIHRHIEKIHNDSYKLHISKLWDHLSENSNLVQLKIFGKIIEETLSQSNRRL